MKTIRLFYIIIVTLPLLALLNYIHPLGIKTAVTQLHLNTLIQSLTIAIFATLLANIAAGFSAYALNFYDIKHKRLLYTVHLLPILLPVTAYGLGFHQLMLRFHLLSTHIGIIIVHAVIILPYAFLTHYDAYRFIGKSYMISARVLGVNELKSVRYILLPLVMPSILSGLSLGAIISFGEYFLTQLIGGGRIKTFSTVFVPFLQSDKRYISASFSLLFIVIAFALYAGINLFSKKYYTALDLDEGR